MKRKKTLTKGKKIKRMRAKLKKIKQYKLWLKKLKTNKNLTKEPEKKSEIKRIGTKLKTNNIWQLITKD